MNKLVMAAMAAAALFTASAASASELFSINPTASSVSVTKDTGGFLQGCAPSSGCALSASLATPFASKSLNVGDSWTFDFANFSISRGVGQEYYTVDATLAFASPIANPASSTGQTSYFTIGGVVDGGQLIWNSVSPITAVDGSVFTVSFANLSGFEIGKSISDDVTITLNSAVPEPASWALMIGGLGLTGFALRRRRVAAAAVA